MVKSRPTTGFLPDFLYCTVPIFFSESSATIPCQMDREEIVQKFENLKVWQRGDERAPHKPLLVLYAIGKLLQGEDRLLPYSEVDEKLGRLLRDFGQKRKSYQPLQLFWRRQNNWGLEIPVA